MEEEANRINFKELAAHNPDVVVIPYNEIINLVMGKKRMLLAPSIKVETTSTEYTFTVMDFKNTNNSSKVYLLFWGIKLL
jgi:hypothetical protein